MDNAVALVQAYLRVNGYLTVTEYPIVEALPAGGFQTATDLDVLGFRFGHSRMLQSPPGSDGGGPVCEIETDSAMDIHLGTPDMIIGEVKEGRAVLNRAASNPGVLAAALTRFGCCEPAHAVELGHALVRHGHAQTRHGHRVRLVAFGSLPPDNPSRGVKVVLLGAIIDYLRAYARKHWQQLQSSESKDPGLGFLMTLEKAERGRRAQSVSTDSTSLKGDHS